MIIDDLKSLSKITQLINAFFYSTERRCTQIGSNFIEAGTVIFLGF